MFVKLKTAITMRFVLLPIPTIIIVVIKCLLKVHAITTKPVQNGYAENRIQ